MKKFLSKFKSNTDIPQPLLSPAGELGGENADAVLPTAPSLERREKRRKKEGTTISIFILATVFFFIYSFLAFSAHSESLKFNSPDETANYFFSKTLAETGEVYYFEEDNLAAQDVIHPRSMRSIDGRVLPASFLGIILFYGFIGKVVGIWIITFLTPLMAALGVIFFYFFIRRIFDEKTAYISALLLFFAPPFWYYAEKSMYHNIPFVVFLIIGFYLLSLQFKKSLKKRSLFFFLGGLSFGLAFSFRMSEIIWASLVILSIYIFYWRKIKIKWVVFFILGIVIPLIVILGFNQLLYGNVLASGYTAGVEKEAVIGYCPITSFLGSVFPFGFDLKNLAKNSFNYLFVIFWFLALPTILGFFIFLKKKKYRRQKIYLILYILMSLWLVLYYGSWEIKDNISLSNITIGNSYIRYWLPIYVFALPFAALFFKRLYYKGGISKKIFYLLFIAYAAFSVNMVFFSGEESILKVRGNIKKYKEIAREIFAITEENAVIISRYEDKIFFPERRVAEFNPDNYGVFLGVSKIIDDMPIYLYDKFIDEDDVDYINNKKIAEYGLRIDYFKKGLYKVVPNNPNVSK